MLYGQPCNVLPVINLIEKAASEKKWLARDYGDYSLRQPPTQCYGHENTICCRPRQATEGERKPVESQSERKIFTGPGFLFLKRRNR